MCPNEMVPLQIDLAIDRQRYLFSRSANPGARHPASCDASTVLSSVGLSAGSALDRLFCAANGTRRTGCASAAHSGDREAMPAAQRHGRTRIVTSHEAR